MFPRNLNLTNLVSLDEWQKVQDSFSEVLEITLRTVSLDTRLLTRVSRPSHLCRKISPNTSIYAEFCGRCILKPYAKEIAGLKEEANFKCSFGMDLFVVPITAVGERGIAYIIMGPLIMKRRKDISEYSEVAKRIGTKLEELTDVLLEINVFSYNKIYAMTNLLRNIFSYMAQTGYHKKRLGEMAPEIREMDPLFSRYYEEKILNSLLNACTLALDADSGSVMTMDKKRHMMHIKAASKLDEKIVQNTHIRVGEGIAGMAAATAKPIILPEDKAKNGLFHKMKRSYIKSSIIVPFPKGSNHEVYGVINLNMVRKNINFSQKDIAFVQELLNLASTALIPFQPNANNSELTS